jgi:hypothetical protein
MNTSVTFIAIGIIILAIIGILVFLVPGKKVKKISPLAGLSFAFLIAGVVFIEKKVVGFSLLGVALILAILDILVKQKKK